jgi:hypothetical protein
MVMAPLQLRAEGGLWFDYPPLVARGGLVPRLAMRMPRSPARL